MSRNAERILGTNRVTTTVVRQNFVSIEHDLRFYEMKTKARKTEEVTVPPVCVHACLTLCHPMVYRLLCPCGFSRQEYWSGWPRPPPGDLPDPRIQLAFHKSPALAGGFLTTSTLWEAHATQCTPPKKKAKKKLLHKYLNLQCPLEILKTWKSCPDTPTWRLWPERRGR